MLSSQQQTLAQQQQQKRLFTDSDFATLYSNPDSYIGSQVNITGKIFNFPPSGIEGYNTLQMRQAGNSDTNVMVLYKAGGVQQQQLSTDNCVRVIGVSGKQFEGTNLFGGTITVATIRADSVQEIDCAIVINPAKKTVVVEQMQEKGGIKVTLHKVEFSDKNTRVYLTVENADNNEDIHFYDFNAEAIQGKTQFGTIYSYDVDYPKIESDIPPGIEENGVVLFKPLNDTRGTAKFVFDASGGGLNDYKFTFVVNIPSA